MRRFMIAFSLIYATAAFGQIDQVDSLAQDFVGDSTPGLGVLVLQRGEVVHMAGYGFANIDAQTPITAATIFDLASVSKEMTALAARAQIEDGLYSEATPISRFLPVMAEIDSPRPITVGDLIHHLSGLTDYLSWDDYDSATPNSSVLDWLARQDLDHPPGTHFAYSNSGYLTLGSLVAVADGADDLAAVLRARIWDGAGM